MEKKTSAQLKQEARLALKGNYGFCAGCLGVMAIAILAFSVLANVTLAAALTFMGLSWGYFGGAVSYDSASAAIQRMGVSIFAYALFAMAISIVVSVLLIGYVRACFRICRGYKRPVLPVWKTHREIHRPCRYVSDHPVPFRAGGGIFPGSIHGHRGRFLVFDGVFRDHMVRRDRGYLFYEPELRNGCLYFYRRSGNSFFAGSGGKPEDHEGESIEGDLAGSYIFRNDIFGVRFLRDRFPVGHAIHGLHEYIFLF